MIQFEFTPNELPSIIKVIGVGGGGSNAVNHMYKLGIKGVDFIVCNTDAQALETSPVPRKIQLGASLTEGRGAGSIPEVGKQSAIENIDELKDILRDNTKMVFITTGMGGGTGTGAAPIIASVAKEMGILTVGIATIPFGFEGRKRKQQADLGIEELKRNVDTLLIICNDKLREIHGNLKLTNAFAYADNVLATAAKSIAEVISVTLHINVDFADVQTVMRDSGVAIMGAAQASGDNRAVRAAELALDSPLLNDNDIEGARYILLNITSGNEEITMDEMGEITDYIQEKAGQSAEIIMGVGTDDSLGDKIAVTIIATGFKTRERNEREIIRQPEKVILHLDKTPMPKFEPEVIDEAPLPEPPFSEPVLKTIEPDIPITSIDYFDRDEPVVKVEETSSDDNRIFEFSDFPNVVTQGEEVKNEAEITPEPEIKSPVNEPKAPERTEPVMSNEPAASYTTAPVNEEDIYQRTRERIEKLKQLSYRMSNPNMLNDLEKEPAYKRKNIKLEDMPGSAELNISRFSLADDGNNKHELKQNNTFLHDKVD